MADTASTTIAILAKAPLAGFAKTRLIPVLGADGAAKLQARLIEQAITTATAARLGPVTLWATPDEHHDVFQAAAERLEIVLARQPEGDLGARMHAAIVAARGPTLVIGADCPTLTPHHLREAAAALRDNDAVAIPAEDGGYVLIGTRRAQPVLFASMEWSVPTVMDETRRRLTAAKLTWRELPPLWDVDTPADLERLRREGFAALLR